MSTLKNTDLEIMNKQLENAKDKYVSKEEVLLILQNKLKDVDAKNEFIIDRIDGVAVKELLDSVNKLKPVQFN